ncbi:MAG: hypothetical protein GY821_12500 [Gammaproteobacteria bacterium]|nr:hypothetical protein [Gammaproteobacteria bacterium]
MEKLVAKETPGQLSLSLEAATTHLSVARTMDDVTFAKLVKCINFNASSYSREQQIALKKSLGQNQDYGISY